MNKFKNKALNGQIVEKFNEIYDMKVTSAREVLDYLSEEFQDNCKYSSDVEDAFDTLYTEHKEFMADFPFAYSLSEEDDVWTIGKGSGFKKENESKYIEIAKEIYTDIEDLDDVLSSIEAQVMNTMSNSGCDVFNALNHVVSEDLEDIKDMDVFSVIGADAEPRVVVLY
jgi:hypothetical protein